MSGVVVNSKTCEIGEPGQPLLAFLRSGLGLTGAKPGCGEGTCGACTVLVDGAQVLACQLRAGDVAGCSVTTIEGLAGPGEPLHPVQRALAAERASQCGYCTPGIALRAAALLAADPEPGDGQIAAALNPCLCRCGCYPRITRAVHRAAAMIREDDEDAPPPEPVPPALARPSRPWDLSEPGERDWFGVLGDGLVAVWPSPLGGAWLHVAPSGAVTAFTGKVDVGQDNQTAFRLLVAEELRADPADVRIVQGDTDVCPYDLGTFGSRSMPDAGMPAPDPADLAGYLRSHPVAGHGWERAVCSEAGDTEAALAAAVTQVKATYTTAYLAHIPLETRAALAEWDDDGRLTVWTGTNVPFAVRARLSQAFGISEAAIRVIVPPVGGGFGGKDGAEAVEAARLARGTGRPVQVRWSRAEEFQRGYLRPMAVIDVRTGLDAAGSITASGFPRHQRGSQRFRLPVRGAQPSPALPASRFPASARPVPCALRDRQHLRARVAHRRTGVRGPRRPAALPPPSPR